MKEKVIQKKTAGQKLKNMVQFVSGIEDLQKWVDIVSVRVSSLAPVAVNVEEIKVQLEETEVRFSNMPMICCSLGKEQWFMVMVSSKPSLGVIDSGIVFLILSILVLT